MLKLKSGHSLTKHDHFKKETEFSKEDKTAILYGEIS